MKWTRWGCQVGQVIHCLEDERIPLGNYILGFVFIIFIRDFFEAFSRRIHYFNFSSALLATDLIHFTLSYTLLALLLIGVLHCMTHQAISKLIRVVLAGFVLIWICPLLDMLIYRHTGVNLLYIQPEQGVSSITRLFFTYFGDFPGVSLGLKIEILMALMGIYIYCRFKKISVVNSTITTLLCYTTIFLWGSSPFLVEYILWLMGFSYAFSSQLMVNFYLIVLPPAAWIIAYLWKPAWVRALMKDMRYLRVMHYELMLLLGVVLGLTYYHYSIIELLRLDQGIVIDVILTMLSLLFASVFSIITNNIADVEIDKISNPARPLVAGKIPMLVYQRLQMISLCLSWFYAWMVNAHVFLIMSVFMGLYYVYSLPPLRLKRVMLLSKLVISINSLALVLIGYVLMQWSLEGFPAVLYAILLIGFTLAANFIDLKDVKGDRAGDIVTLPIFLGEKRAKQVIGAAFFTTYVSFYYLLPYYFLMPLFIAGGLIQFYLINRSRYRESYVLIFNNASIFMLMIILFWFG